MKPASVETLADFHAGSGAIFLKRRKSHTPSTESSYSTGDDLEISRKHKDPNSTRIQRQNLRPNKYSFGIQSLADFGNELAATSHAPSARTSSGSSNSFRRASHSCFQGPPPDASVKKLGVPPGSPWHHTFPSFSINPSMSPPKKALCISLKQHLFCNLERKTFRKPSRPFTVASPFGTRASASGGRAPRLHKCTKRQMPDSLVPTSSGRGFHPQKTWCLGATLGNPLK